MYTHTHTAEAPQDALHLVDSLDVLLVRAVHVARVHVLVMVIIAITKILIRVRFMYSDG